MAVLVPENVKPPFTVIFEYRISSIEWLSYATSGSAMIVLVVYVMPMRIALKDKIISLATRIVRKLTDRLESWWEQD